MKDEVDAEKLQLIGKLAGDEAEQGGAQFTKKANRPDWQDLASSGAIPSSLVPDLVRVSDNPKLLTQQPKYFPAFFTVINLISDDSNAVHYCADMVIDACRIDTYNWTVCADLKDIDGNPSQLCCFHAFMRPWKEQATNDSLAFLVAGLQSYRHALQDPRPLYSAIVDPNRKNLSNVGRLAAIANLLKDDSLRLDLCGSSTFRGVINHGIASKNLTEVYHAMISLWLLSFNKGVIQPEGPLFIHRSLLRNFLETLSSCRAEKIVRAAIQCLKNLLQEPWILEALFHKKIDHTLTLLDYEKWRDPKMYDELEALSKMLYQQFSQMSNFSRYVKELDTGKFFPGPTHTEKFWIENVNAFEDNEFGPIQKLARLIRTCDDPTTLSLALFDLGEFGRLHPTGKRVLNKLGAKAAIMTLMNHANKEVAREALLTTQKMMLDNWKEIGGEAQERHQKVVA